VLSVRHRLVLVAVAVLATACGLEGSRADVRVVPESGVRSIDATADDRDAVRPAAGGEVADDEVTAELTEESPTGEMLVVPDPVDPPQLLDVVGVVGDSLTVSAEDEVDDEFATLGIDVVVNAREGRRMTAGATGRTSGLDAIESVAASATPDLWVIALGTNDVGAQSGVDRFRADVRATIAALPRDVPLVWVDLWIRDLADEVVVANSVLRTELARRTGPTAIVDWHQHGGDDGLFTGDGVHLTEAGQSAFADAITSQVVALSVGSGRRLPDRDWPVR
jgi:lysophospholipase L1-like esterase